MLGREFRYELLAAIADMEPPHGQDSGAVCSYYLGLNHLWQGEPDRAIETMSKACEVAELSQFSSTLTLAILGLATTNICSPNTRP